MQKYSQLVGQTNKSAKEFSSKNATLLLKAGYVDQLMAGVYSYLPLGLRVLNKIEKIVRDEMNTVAQEVFMPTLQPVENWQQTKRFDKVDVLLKAVPANDNSMARHNSLYVVGPTHEDVVTPLVQKFAKSYKDFPKIVYQIQSKFRNEPRAKSGLLRGREFRMKDAYSFDTSLENFEKTYELMRQVYVNIYSKLGIGEDTVYAAASGGDFTKSHSNEFQTKCDSGEDLMFEVPSTGVVYNREVAPAKAPRTNIDANEEEKPREDVLGKGIIGVEALAEFLKIPVEKTTKTMIYETNTGKVVAAAVRGDYDINEEKLSGVLKVDSVKLASEEIVKEVTKAEVGYAGILDLPTDVEIIFDESVVGRANFECGANKTDYHSVNVNFGRDLPEPTAVYDIKTVNVGDLDPQTNEEYKTYPACEVGNIFPLMTKFPDAFNYKYTSETGELKQVYMGCYGIGTSRVMGVIAEKYNDEKGLAWPKQVAPFAVHFITLNGDMDSKAEELITKLEAAGHDVLWDDRAKASAGEKFNDSELIGIPVRVVLTKRSVEAGGVEVKLRSAADSKVVSLEELVNTVDQLLQ